MTAAEAVAGPAQARGQKGSPVYIVLRNFIVQSNIQIEYLSIIELTSFRYKHMYIIR